MTVTKLLVLISLMHVCPIASADQVNFMGEFSTELGSYSGIDAGDAFSINIFYTSALSGSGVPTVMIDAAYMYVGTERWALSNGAPGITVDADADSTVFAFTVSDSTGSGYDGGTISLLIDNADDCITDSEASEANILAVLFDGNPDGSILFAPGAGGVLIGTTVAVPEPASVIAFSGLGLLIVCGQLRRRKKRKKTVNGQD